MLIRKSVVRLIACAVISMILLQFNAFGQSVDLMRIKLRQRYGQSDMDRFRFRRDFELTVFYSGSGHVCEMGIARWKPAISSPLRSRMHAVGAIPGRILDDMLDELAPAVERGRPIETSDTNSGRDGGGTQCFEHVDITRLWISFKGRARLYAALIRFKSKECRALRGSGKKRN